ncbi:unnamed protein product [Nezara viridula]|uniref:Uncharacterized protein n=1 Tax=Nezara viridula TaxID=85310 RepID=A0A9P0E0R3_NEZVI|nr:unnamed protein product [Nezara viridula]
MDKEGNLVANKSDVLEERRNYFYNLLNSREEDKVRNQEEEINRLQLGEQEMDLEPLGGLPDLSKVAVEAVPKPPVPFSGCVRRVWINWRTVPLDKHHVLSARNVHDCDGTACGGDNYMGERCEKQASCQEVGCEHNGRCLKDGKSFKCHCPAGWTGPFCNIEVPLGMPHFGGDGYLVVDTKHGVAKRGGISMTEPAITYIYFNFSSSQNDGMLLWSSKEDNFIGFGLENGLLKAVWGLTAEESKSVLLPGTLISDGAWHALTTSINDGKINFSTDGGFPDDKKVYAETYGYFQSSFNGCVKEFAWNRQFSVVDFSKYSGSNLGSCDLFTSRTGVGINV